MKDCQFGVSPVNYSDSDSDLNVNYSVGDFNLALSLFFFFFIQFNVPFKIISLIETSQSIGGAKQEYPGKTT